MTEQERKILRVVRQNLLSPRELETDPPHGVSRKDVRVAVQRLVSLGFLDFDDSLNLIIAPTVQGMSILEDEEPLEVSLEIVVGLYETIAVVRAEASEPDFWEKEHMAVGTFHPDDLGIPNVPTEPGRYVWEGVLKVWGPSLDGDYEVDYVGSWGRC